MACGKKRTSSAHAYRSHGSFNGIAETLTDEQGVREKLKDCKKIFFMT